MSHRRHEFSWPKREVIRDDLGRITSELHIHNGQVIARATYDPDGNYRTSYSSGGVTLFFNKEGILTRKEIRNDTNNLSVVETYSPESGQLHSLSGSPSTVKYTGDGNVIYMGWHKNGKKHRAAKYDEQEDKLIPQPSIVRKLPEGITENAYYRDDALTDPAPNFAAIQYQNEKSEIVLRCHFKDNMLHNAEDPAILAEHDTSRLIAHAKNGRVVKACFEEPMHTVDYEFDEKGQQVGQFEEIDLSAHDIDDATFNAIAESLATRVADEEASRISQVDEKDPNVRREMHRLQKQNEGGSK